MKKIQMLIAALVVGIMLVAAIISFISFGIGHPLPWLLIAALIAVPFFINRGEAKHFAVWKDEYSVGIKSIDDDHRKLLSLINNLQTAIHYHTGDVFEKQALNELVDYTKYHFTREEDLLRQADYPDFDAHKAEHTRMINKVEDFLDAYNQRGHDALQDIADFLKNWLIEHINGTDKAYSHHLISKGTK